MLDECERRAWERALQDGPFKLTKRQADNFIAKINFGEPSQCWEWLASTRRSYPAFTTHEGSRDGHRIAFFSFNPSCSLALHALHKCDNPICCNPGHLFAGTQQANMADKVTKGRHPVGERAAAARLTVHDVSALKARRADGAAYKELAKAFGISISQAHRVATGAQWRHLETPPV